MKIKNLIILPALALAVLFAACEKEPKASFSVNKTEVEIEEVVTFTNTTVDAETYSWNFGDGNTSTLLSPTHKYTTAGTYTVTLTVKSKDGNKTDVATATITVKEATSNNGLTYQNITYPLTKGTFYYYGIDGNNLNSYNFDIFLIDDSLDYINQSGHGNMIYFEAWSNLSTELTDGIYTFSVLREPSTYSAFMFGFNLNYNTSSGDIFDAIAGDFTISKTGNEHVISATITLENNEIVEVNFKGVFDFVDNTQTKSTIKKFRK